MKPEEAIRIIEVAKAECEWNTPLEYQEAFDAAIETLEKQIPEEPEDIKIINNPAGYFITKIGICPCCGEAVDYYCNDLMCDFCGQAIDWGDNYNE